MVQMPLGKTATMSMSPGHPAPRLRWNKKTPCGKRLPDELSHPALPWRSGVERGRSHRLVAHRKQERPGVGVVFEDALAPRLGAAVEMSSGRVGGASDFLEVRLHTSGIAPPQAPVTPTRPNLSRYVDGISAPDDRTPPSLSRRRQHRHRCPQSIRSDGPVAERLTLDFRCRS